MAKKGKRIVVGLMCFSVLLVSVLASGQDGAERRIKYNNIARALNPGEIALLVSSTGVVTVLADGKYCGTITIDITSIAGSESYKEDFFAPLDQLLEQETGKRIGDFVDLFLFFDSSVNDEDVSKYRGMFRRYKVYHYNCCNADHAYSCCPSRISPWFLRVPATPDVVRCVQYLKMYEIAHIIVLIISDGSPQDFGVLGGQRRIGPASLLAWLRTLEWVASVQEIPLEVSPTGAVRLSSKYFDEMARPRTLTIVILAYDRSRYGALGGTIEQAVLEEVARRQANPVLLLLTFPQPTAATITASLLGQQPLGLISGGAVLVSSTVQDASVLEEALTVIHNQRMNLDRLYLSAVIYALRIYGFVVYSYCTTIPVGQ